MYKTGDFGCIKNGLLFFEGRRDAQIKIRGHRVDISEIEKNVTSLDYVEKAAILVYHTGQSDQALVSCIVLKKTSDKSGEKKPEDVEKDLKDRLASYMIPQVQIIEEFPYLTSGKVDRQKLLKIYESKGDNDDVKLGPKIDLTKVPKDKYSMAKQVFEIISESLANQLRNKVSVKSNFFELGGNSMNSILTVNQLRNHGFYISITDFLAAENLGEVLNKISVQQIKTDDTNFVKKLKLVAEPIDHLEKEVCIQLLATSFFKKSDLDHYVPGLEQEHYEELIRGMWDSAVKQGLSFMVKNEDGEIVGVSLNFDVEDHPESNSRGPLKEIIEFFDSIEKPIM